MRSAIRMNILYVVNVLSSRVTPSVFVIIYTEFDMVICSVIIGIKCAYMNVFSVFSTPMEYLRIFCPYHLLLLLQLTENRA